MNLKFKKKSKTAMSKTSRKTHDRSEHLHGLLREKEKEIKTLKQELRQFKKRESLYENNREEIQEVLVKKEEKKKLRRCTDCSKGFYEEIELMGKVFGTCKICGFRERLK